MMDIASLISEKSSQGFSRLENGWYLLRRNAPLSARTYRAGTLVEYRDGEWFLAERHADEVALSLTPEMVCRTFYHGVSLYELECDGRGNFFARPVLSDLPSFKVDSMLVHLSLESGDARVCVKFGHCFLPLELFNW